MSETCHNGFLGEVIPVDLGDGVSTEATVAYSDGSDVDRLVFIFPPNPMLGGDSRNNVIQALLAGCAARDALGVTFDYRGSAEGRVGAVDLMSYWENLQASGDYGVVLDDAERVFKAVCRAFGASRCRALAGYSFGSCMALLSAPRFGYPPVAGISPPIAEHDLGPWLPRRTVRLFAAPEDPFCPPDRAAELLAPHGLTLDVLTGCDHFFRGFEEELARRVLDALGITER